MRTQLLGPTQLKASPEHPAPAARDTSVWRRWMTGLRSPKTTAGMPGHRYDDLQDERDAERRFISALAEGLDDLWWLGVGYANQRGQADFVLIGPPGVCLIEVCYIEGIVSGSDAEGWLVETAPRGADDTLPDIPGAPTNVRSTCEMVIDVASDLEQYLARTVPSTHVRTAVVLTHRSSLVGQALTRVDLLTTLAGVTTDDLLPSPGESFDRGAIDTLARLVAIDHEYHARESEAV